MSTSLGNAHEAKHKYAQHIWVENVELQIIIITYYYIIDAKIEKSVLFTITGKRIIRSRWSYL